MFSVGGPFYPPADFGSRKSFLFCFRKLGPVVELQITLTALGSVVVVVQLCPRRLKSRLAYGMNYGEHPLVLPVKRNKN